MKAFEVKYKNGEDRGIMIALCKESADEIETIMRNNRIAFTEIVSIRTPRVPIPASVRKDFENGKD